MMMSGEPDGEIRPTGEDDFEIVFVRRLRHPVEKVWAALTVPERIADWFTEMRFDPDLRLRARVELRFDNPDFILTEGRVIAFEPPRLFAWTWPHEDHPGSVVRCELTPAPGGCELRFSQTHMRRKLVADVTGGWHTFLEGLDEAAAGRRAPAWTAAREKVHADRYGAVINKL